MSIPSVSNPAVPPQADVEEMEHISLWKDTVARLVRNRLAVFALVLLVGLAVFVLAGPFIASSGFGILPRTTNVLLGAHPPSSLHFFGTDILGRDVMVRVMQGGRLSLLVGLLATTVSVVIGTIYGAISGYVGGRLDNVMMRVVDVLYALPYMFLVIILMVAVRELRALEGLPAAWRWALQPTVVLFFALGAVQWLTMARIVRGQVLSLKRRDFIAAAKMVGVSKIGILFRHLIPNTAGSVVVYTTLTIPGVILQEAFLSFLGLGVEAPESSWGTLVNEGAKAMAVFPWLLLFPSLFLGVTVFALNALGDGLRQALEPASRRS